MSHANAIVDPERIACRVGRSAEVIGALQDQAESIAALCQALVDSLAQGGQALAAGNGGSAAEAMHFAEELVGRFKSDRRALPALALASDATVLTCIANDFGFENLFSRQVEAWGRAGDILALFSTSGRSVNLLRALEAGRARSMTVLCLLGRDGGDLTGKADHEIIVRCKETEHIQEAHQVLVHLMLDAVENHFAEKGVRSA